VRDDDNDDNNNNNNENNSKIKLLIIINLKTIISYENRQFSLLTRYHNN